MHTELIELFCLHVLGQKLNRPVKTVLGRSSCDAIYSGDCAPPFEKHAAHSTKWRQSTSSCHI